ncbi:hypothetical protein [Lutispora sp.]|uniref:hypothetical protein n=1 Tax=Lutispora sp. TaxID=2828727 RepID=UPI000EBEDF26|nr:hypothetical protein [Lutispora sp.]MEA4960324.1 hypothetical protein [Lutispora sp.]HCJ57263.1 hypothetical protein [Clostridiaceae bacterium]
MDLTKNRQGIAHSIAWYPVFIFCAWQNSDEIKPCIGCWVKTPGLCVITNDCANHISNIFMRFEKLHKTGQNMTEPSHIMLKDKFARNRILALQYLYDEQTGDF